MRKASAKHVPPVIPPVEGAQPRTSNPGSPWRRGGGERWRPGGFRNTWSAQASARLCTRDGQALHHDDIGRGEPVVRLDGFGMHGALWLPFVLPLAGRYRFLLPDLRGFGFSHRLSRAEPSAIGQHSRDVDDLVTGHDLHDVRLGGLSMGACTAPE